MTALPAALVGTLYGWAVLASTVFHPGWIGPNHIAPGTDWMVFYGSVTSAVQGNLSLIMNGDDFIGGVPPSAHRDPHASAHWLLYFDVADCAVAIEKTKSLGGKLLYGPVSMESVRSYAVLADPQGAAFGIVQTIKSRD